MPQFVHLSDPHLTPLLDVPLRALLGKRLLGYLSWQRRRRFRHLPELLASVTADALATPPAHVALTGDLTQIGLPSEHQLARAWLENLGPPSLISLAPGNHDFYAPDSARSLYAAWSDYFAAGPLAANGSISSNPQNVDIWPQRRDCGELCFISLCSGAPCGLIFATGTLGASQLERLATLLQATRGRYRVLLVHHSPHPDGHAWRKRLTDAERLRAVLEAHGVELVLHGHAHQAQLAWLQLPSRRIPVLGAPSASLRSSDQQHRAGYHRITVDRSADGWETRIETRQYVDAQAGALPQMQTSATHAFSLPAG